MRISGTYYTPNIIPLFIIAGAGTTAAVVYSFRKKTFPAALSAALFGIVAVNLGIILIGKYSQPSIIFAVPFLVILICSGIESFNPKTERIIYAAAAAVLLLNSILMITEALSGEKESMADYTEKIAEVIPPESRTLGGLQSGFYFNDGQLLDWRNLAFLDKAEITFEEYIQNSGIEYIIYTQEIDYIYNSRPVWNILYGNPVVYYKPLQQFLSQHGELISEFNSPGYGTRLTLHRNKRNQMVRIYRVK
jgi:hypothetical protein